MFTHTDSFREVALTFQELGRYCEDPPYSTAWYNFWKQEKDRCINGLKTGSGYIPGYFYNYLNYCPILKVNSFENESEDEFAQTAAERVSGFPRFIDGDYDFYTYLNEAEKSGEHALLLGSRGKGKEAPDYQLVITPYGEKRLGDLKVGDIITGNDGKPTKVLEIFPQGIKDVYTLTLSDGRKVECGIDHLWGLLDCKNKYHVKSLRFILENPYKYKHKKSGWSYKWALPINDEVIYQNNNTLPINPYLIGCLLGDGCLKTKTPKISSKDIELIDTIRDMLPDYELKKDKTCYNYTIVYKGKERPEINGKKYRVNLLTKEIEKLQINVNSIDKFIPEVYKYSSVEDRYELVRGLLDTDGCILNNGCIEFTNISEKLVDDLAYILRSLGIVCTKGISDRRGRVHKINNVETTDKNISYRLYIKTEKPVFKLSRKLKKIQPLKSSKKVSIINIEKTGRSSCRCIMIDNDSKLFLVQDFVVTHNSYKAASMGIRNYFHLKDSKSYYIGAHEGAIQGDGILPKCWSMMSFIDENTPWGKRRQVKNDAWHRRASVINNIDGKLIEQGYKSEIMGITVGDRDIKKVRGIRGKLAVLEEFGAFPMGIKTISTLRSSFESGNKTFGLILAIGTGGEEGSNFEAMDEIFNKPRGYKFHAVTNKWDEGLENTECGFFYPYNVGLDGFYDDNGNSDTEKAKEFCLHNRKVIAVNSNDPTFLIRRMAEEPLKPREAMMRLSGTKFPIIELKQQEGEIETKDHIYKNADFVGRLEIDRESQQVVFVLDNTLSPLNKQTNQKDKLIDKKGAVVIFEHPKDEEGNWYIGGVDPYDHDEVTASVSLGSCFIMDKRTKRIVAEYTGRPSKAKEFYETCRRLALYYNARLNIERTRGKGMFDYFEQQKSYFYCAEEPRAIREYKQEPLRSQPRKGTNADEMTNAYCRELVADWLMSKTDNPEKQEELYVHILRSLGAVKELISWNPMGNFDRVDALGMLLLYMEDFKKYEIKDNEIKIGQNITDKYYLKVLSKNKHFRHIFNQY